MVGIAPTIRCVLVMLPSTSCGTLKSTLFYSSGILIVSLQLLFSRRGWLRVMHEVLGEDGAKRKLNSFMAKA